MGGLGYHYGPTQGEKSSTMLVAWGSKVNGTLRDGFLRVPDVGRQFEHSIVSRGLKRFFKSVDLDKDGGLTFAELANFSHEAESQQLQRKAKKLSRRMDKNYDRKVSVEEVCQANKVKLAVNNTEENVKVADVDGDGFLSKDEFLSLLSPRNDDAQTTLNQIVSATDENKDGNVTLAEWTKAWDILDADEANERLSSWKDRMSMHAELMEANAESSQQEDLRGDDRAPRGGARGSRMEDMDSPRGGKGRGPRNDERVPRGGRSSGRGGGQKKNSA